MFPRPLPLAVLLVLAVGCKSDDDSDDTDTDTTSADDTDSTDDDGDVFTVTVNVNGLDDPGLPLVLSLDGEELEIDEDGDFTFDVELDDGDDYEVELLSGPRCPAFRCEVEDAEGTVEGEDVELDVTCEAPSSVTLYMGDWSGDGALRISDDVLGALVESVASVTPREVSGPASGISDSEGDSVAVDPARELVYFGTAGGILVFTDDDTLEGDVAPVRTFTTADLSSTEWSALELDVARDRLYAFHPELGLVVFDDASTLDGTVTPTAVVEEVTSYATVLDPVHDRLFIASNYDDRAYVFDDASEITSESEPSRTVVWTTTTGFQGGPSGAAYDVCSDRLWLAANNPHTASGAYVVAFDDASTLDGDVDFATDTSVRLLGAPTTTIVLAIDDQDRLWMVADNGGESFGVYTDPAALTGEDNTEPNFWIEGASEGGYGIVPMSQY